MKENIKFLPAGDSSVVIEFGNTISHKINCRVQNMATAINKAQKDYILELIPTYRSLLVNYNPLKIFYDQLIEELYILENIASVEDAKEVRIIEIPVLYGGDYGVDLEFVAKHNNLNFEEIIEIHTSRDYFVYMLGFTPGFPYLGGMDKKISAPRLTTPRLEIPAGSVGIAGSQTGIYPIDSPGGWQLIGSTPIKLYNPLKHQPFLLKSGDYIRFTSITSGEFLRIKEQVKEDRYLVNIIKDAEIRVYE